MSYNFRAGQYERAFAPRALCNWSPPKWYPARPRSPARRPKPVFLTDNKGHLLPGVRRGSPAWKDYPTAWDYPRRLTREKIKELTKEPPAGRYLDWAPHINKTSRYCPDNNTVKKSPKTVSEQNDANTEEPKLDYEPGKLIDPKDKVEAPPLEPPLKSLQELCNEHEIEAGILENNENLVDNMKEKETNIRRAYNGRLLPDVNYIPGFQYARKMHMDNLLHHPLPDTMTSKIYNKPRSNSHDIDIKPYSTSWIRKDINGQRPVTSGGMLESNKVSREICPPRPATSGNEKNINGITPINLAIQWDFRTRNPRDEPKRPKHIDGSNNSMAPAVFSMVHSPNPINDLKDEVGRSNAIFSQNIPPDDYSTDRIVPRFDNDMSKNRRKECCDVPKCKQHSKYEKARSHSADSKYKSKHNNNEMELNKTNNNVCDGVHGCGSSNSSTQKRSNGRIVKDAWMESANELNKNENIDNNMLNNNKNESSTPSFNKDRLHQSSPNLAKDDSTKSKTDTSSQRTQDTNLSSKMNRSCIACDRKNEKLDECVKKTEYKMAFKAGKPNLTAGSDSKSSETYSKNSVKIPKMKDHNSKKSYDIPTLAPPFSRWKDTSGYPEHWRLASIYQHAYKHPDARKHALLPAVFH